MALTHISIVALGLIFAQISNGAVSDEAVSEQAALANLLASANEAQEVCSLPGEAFQMMSYVRQVQPSFDVVNDPGDARAVSVALRQVKTAIRKLGAKAWCEIYVRERQDLLRTKARPDCDDMPGLCGSLVTVREGFTSRMREEGPPAVRPAGIALAL